MTDMPTIGIKRLPHGEGIELPHYATEGAAGADLRAAVPEDAPLEILPGMSFMVPTGHSYAIPPG